MRPGAATACSTLPLAAREGAVNTPELRPMARLGSQFKQAEILQDCFFRLNHFGTIIDQLKLLSLGRSFKVRRSVRWTAVTEHLAGH